ncbi:uncharacterized protein E0L32_001689 [Thyridium curvatum]|uniref:Chitin-binding type-1 domain-containing protein n=1 Tax=Thyridium curvatum TaxID=1093900 RepID=A0A507AW62_9PEZI|nr:uncharacterized protein E0L32_001689 [Thyridium curvatum]TPX09229.1 hypothetical protein E0L32_001689 [Thyridium curvatum]
MIVTYLLLAAIPASLFSAATAHPPAALPASLDTRAPQKQVSPDGTCGAQPGGEYFCPFDQRCCSGHGYCGSGDDYCLTSLGCQPDYAAPGSNACYAPRDGVTVSPDNTCGKTGDGVYGYRCPADSLICCSQYTYVHKSAKVGAAIVGPTEPSANPVTPPNLHRELASPGWPARGGYCRFAGTQVSMSFDISLGELVGAYTDGIIIHDV